MHQATKTEWLEALRSGQFKQGTGALKCVTSAGETQHCCMGVLAEVAGFGLTPDPEWKGYYQVAGRNGTLVPELLDRVGMTPIQQSTLVNMNDGAYEVPDQNPRPRASFAEIADYIEANL